ncbi:MAG: hypothetical protein ACOH5I_04200 [Oligoflexus sp.]
MLRKTMAAALLLGSWSLQAADFSKADSLFSAREGSLTNTQAARAAYKELIATGLTGADLERAVVGIARSYTYEGEALTGKVASQDVEKRRDLFRSCWKDTMPLIAPDKLGYESPAYYYFSAACMAYYAEVSGTLENLANAPTMLRLLEKGLQSEGGTTYEGGGLNRVKAAVKSNAKAKPLPGGLYNPQEALTLIDEAIDSPAYPGSYDGFLFCENYRRKTLVLTELERTSDSLKLAQTSIEDFELYLEIEEIPAELIPETKHCIDVLQAIVEDLQ